MTHVYRWRKYRPAWFGRPCRILARGSLNSVLIQFAGGELAVVSRFALRRTPRFRAAQHARKNSRNSARNSC